MLASSEVGPVKWHPSLERPGPSPDLTVFPTHLTSVRLVGKRATVSLVDLQGIVFLWWGLSSDTWLRHREPDRGSWSICGRVTSTRP